MPGRKCLTFQGSEKLVFLSEEALDHEFTEKPLHYQKTPQIEIMMSP